jgi:hypothetical protein
MSSSRPQVPPIPERIEDRKTNTIFIVGRLLGKGGFARVHKFSPLIHKRDEATGQVREAKGPEIAGKVVARV